MSSGKEPAAKMVKQEEQEEQEDYTKTHPSEFKRFHKRVLTGSYEFPPKIIDGVEVITTVGAVPSANMVILELVATKECHNGFMFLKRSNMCYKMFKKIFYCGGIDRGIDRGRDQMDMDFYVSFNNVMAFVVKEIPNMKLYGNKLVTGTTYTILTSALEEGVFFHTLPVVSRCRQCDHMNDGKLLMVDAAGRHGMKNPIKRACLKCYLNITYTEFDTDVANHMLDYDRDKIEFDRLGSRKFVERYEGGLIHQDMYGDDDEETDAQEGSPDAT